MSLKFTWPEKNFSQELTSFNLKEAFGDFSSDTIYCGEFNKHIKFEDGEFQVIYFFNFSVRSGMVVFKLSTGTNFFFETGDYEGLEFKIIEPVPVTIPDPLNLSVTHGNEIICLQLFTKYNDSILPLGSFKGKWGQIYGFIQSALETAGYGSFSIKVEVIGANKGSVPARNIFSMFPKAEEIQLKKFMIIVATSEKIPVFLYKDKPFPLAYVRNSLKDIVLKCAKLLMKFKIFPKTRILCRRLVSACLNGSALLDVIDEIRNEINDESIWDLNSSEFLREEIITIDVDTNYLIRSILKVPIHNLKCHLLKNSLEAQYRSIFWDQLLSDLFHSFHPSNQQPQSNPIYRLQSEWNTKNLSPHLDERFVDWVDLYKFAGFEIPMLTCEMGYLPFGLGINAHKDFSKLLAVISPSCIKLAKLLEANGKRAEDACNFGLWIGGSQFQLVTARAIVSGEPNNLQIHINISFKPIWKHDVLSPEFAATTEPANEFESTSVTAIETESVPPLDALSIDFDREERELLIRNQQQQQRGVNELIYRNNLNFDSLAQIYSFISHIMSKMNYLSSEASDRPVNVPPRTFKCPDEGGFIPGSRTETDQTPKKLRVELVGALTTPARQMSGPPPSREIFVNEERTLAEFELYRRYLFHVPSFFPKLFQVLDNPKYEDYFDFYAEKMVPLTDSSLEFTSLEDGLIKSLKVAVQLLNCLDFLHSEFKLVHSDISPRNVMFSEEYDTWKLNDFGQTVKLEESLKKSRIAGTDGYISPESLDRGIFNEASDIYALGQVFFYYFDVELTTLKWKEGPESEILIGYANEYANLVSSMINIYPETRPTARQVCLSFYEILLNFENSFDSSQHPVFIRVDSIYREHLKEIKEIEFERIAKLVQQKSEIEDIVYSVKDNFRLFPINK